MPYNPSPWLTMIGAARTSSPVSFMGSYVCRKLMHYS